MERIEDVEYGERGQRQTMRETGGRRVEDAEHAVRELYELHVAPEQHDYVADNAISIAQARFEPKARFRAIYADETPGGLVMLSDCPDAPEYFLWRLMVAAAYQGMGFGARAARELSSRTAQPTRLLPQARLP